MKIDLLKNFDLKKKIIAINVILLAGLAVVVFSVIIPSVTHIKEIQGDINSQLSDLEMKYLKGQSLKKLAVNLKIIEPQINKLDSVFASQNQELDFITTIEDAASKAGVSQKISMGTAQKLNEQYKKIPLQISAQGTLRQLMEHMARLESLNYYLNTKSIEISAVSADKDQGASIYNISLSIDSYWK